MTSHASAQAISLSDKKSSNRINSSIMMIESLNDLVHIKKSEVELVVCRHKQADRLQEWLEQMDESQLPDFRVLIHPSDLQSAIEPYMDESGMPFGYMRQALIQDIEGLVKTYADLAQAELVDIRFECISHDACWKFHRDNVDMRLLKTYRGPATEWVHPQHAEQALKEQKTYAGSLEKLDTFDVSIFKGSLYGQNRGIVHRSPPIAGSNQTRLMLCLNKQSAASPELWVPTAL